MLAYRQGSPGAALLVFAFAVVFPVLVALDPSRLTITPTAVEIAFPVHTRMIGFADIGSVELVNVPRTGNVRPTVVLHPRGGKPVLLSHFRGGALALHAALRAAWVSAGQT